MCCSEFAPHFTYSTEGPFQSLIDCVTFQIPGADEHKFGCIPRASLEQDFDSLYRNRPLIGSSSAPAASRREFLLY